MSSSPDMAPEGSPTGPSTSPVYCVTCCKQLEQPGADRCLACQSPQRGMSLTLFKYGSVIELLKGTLLAALIPIAVFAVTHWYTNEEKEGKKNQQRYDQVLGALADTKVALASLYQPCLNTDWKKCRALAGQRLSAYQEHVARFGLAVNRFEPEFDPTVQLLFSMDAGILEHVRQIWEGFTYCIEDGGSVLECDEMRSRIPLLNLQAAFFVMDYLACSIEAKYVAELETEMSTRCWAITVERAPICRDRPREIVKAFADAMEKGGQEGVYRLEFQGVIEDIIENYLIPGSGLSGANRPVSPNESQKEP